MIDGFYLGVFLLFLLIDDTHLLLVGLLLELLII